MDITENNSTEIDAFEAGWNDIDSDTVEVAEADNDSEDITEDADQQEGEEVTTDEEEGAQEENESEEEEQEQTETDQSKSSDTFQLKYMGETKSVGRNEAVVLAQKGMDYDRVTAQRDEGRTRITELEGEVGRLKNLESFMTEVSAASGMDIQGFIDATRAQMLVEQEKAKGRELSPELALEWAVKQREQAAAAEPKKEEAEEQPEGQSAEDAKRMDDFTAFAMNFPDVNAEDIPQTVWDEYRESGSLVAPYALYENKQLKAKIKTLEQNLKNRERSTGSRKSSGSGNTVRDPFEDGFNSL